MIRNTFLRNMLIIVIINIAVFLFLGKLLYDKRADIGPEKIDRFFGALQNEKVGTYYLSLDKLAKKHEYIKIIAADSAKDNAIKEACYKIYPERLVPSPDCGSDLIIELDRHFMGSFLSSSFYSKGIIFSEILQGHIKIYGIKIDDISAVL